MRQSIRSANPRFRKSARIGATRDECVSGRINCNSARECDAAGSSGLSGVAAEQFRIQYAGAVPCQFGHESILQADEVRCASEIG